MDMHLYICTCVCIHSLSITSACKVHMYMTLYVCNTVRECEARCVCTHSMPVHMNTYSNICMYIVLCVFMYIPSNLPLTSHPGGLYCLSGLV